MCEDKKKKFISERIVGRDVTGDRIIKWLLLTIVCAVVFGFVSAGVSHLAEKNIEKKEVSESLAAAQKGEEDMADSNTDANGPENQDNSKSLIKEEDSSETSDDDENPGETKDAPENDDNKETEGEEESSEAGQNSDNKDKTFEGENTNDGDTAAESGEEPQTESITGDNIVKILSENEDFNAFLNGTETELAKSISNYVVSVQCISKDKTWFDDMIESTDTYAGVIAEVNEGEILVLTKNFITESSNELRVVFSDGSANQAVIKTRSVSDGLCVVAVSTEGLGEEIVGKLEPVEFSEKDITCGDRVLTIGAPLGVVNSVDYGYVGYAAANLQGQDAMMDVVFADIEANADKGTFLMDTDGKLAGIAIKKEEAGLEDVTDSVSAFEEINSLKGTIENLLNGKAEVILGIKGVDVSFDMKYSNVPEGMYITDIKKSYPAYNVGIKPGDIITKIDGNEINNVGDYVNAMSEAQPGKAVGITVSRSAANDEYREIDFSCIPRQR